MSSFRTLFCWALTLGFALSAFAGDKDKKTTDEQYSNIHFVVIKDFNEKPVRNASVILHPVNKDGTQAKGGFQLKTDNDGKTETDGIPYGPLRIQVLMQGFQTFGDDYQINQPDTVITIRLKRPTEQFSAYDKDKQKGDQAAPPASPPSETPHQ